VPIYKYEDKVAKLTDSKKEQKSRIMKRLDGKLVCYINRDGFAVRIEKKIGGGYIKTIGLGFDDHGNIGEVLGTKRKNVFFTNSFGAKNKYSESENDALKLAKSRVANSVSKITHTAPNV
jgi:hypothetical protein